MAKFYSADHIKRNGDEHVGDMGEKRDLHEFVWTPEVNR